MTHQASLSAFASVHNTSSPCIAQSSVPANSYPGRVTSYSNVMNSRGPGNWTTSLHPTTVLPKCPQPPLQSHVYATSSGSVSDMHKGYNPYPPSTYSSPASHPRSLSIQGFYDHQSSQLRRRNENDVLYPTQSTSPAIANITHSSNPPQRLSSQWQSSHRNLHQSGGLLPSARQRQATQEGYPSTSSPTNDPNVDTFAWSPAPSDQYLHLSSHWGDVPSPPHSPQTSVYMPLPGQFLPQGSAASQQPESHSSPTCRKSSPPAHGTGGRRHMSPSSTESTVSPSTSRRPSVDQLPSNSGGKICSHCHATSTPLWRREPTTLKPLCNACGLYLQQRNKHRPQELIDADAAEEDSESEHDGTGPECSHCHTHRTSVWRRSKTGAQLCNACGVYSRLRGRDRPLSLKRNRIKPRTKHNMPR